MSHPKSLIDRVAALLAEDYPTSVYSYVFERALKGTRMMPDIAIFRPGEVQPTAVVEIGYTRPEKLTAYRNELKIPDVRWYDKRGHLHSPLSEVVEVVRIDVTPAHQFYRYSVSGVVGCSDDDCDSRCWEDGCPDRCRHSCRFAETTTQVFTDYIRVLMPTYCDGCGRQWNADPRDDGSEIAIDLQNLSATEFGMRYGARRPMSWEEVKAETDESLRYVDLAYLDEEVGRQAALEVVRITRR